MIEQLKQIYQLKLREITFELDIFRDKIDRERHIQLVERENLIQEFLQDLDKIQNKASNHLFGR